MVIVDEQETAGDLTEVTYHMDGYTAVNGNTNHFDKIGANVEHVLLKFLDDDSNGSDRRELLYAHYEHMPIVSRKPRLLG